MRRLNRISYFPIEAQSARAPQREEAGSVTHRLSRLVTPTATKSGKQPRQKTCSTVLILLTLQLLGSLAKAEDEQPTQNRRIPIPIAEINRTASVDFEKEVLPILKNNCLACHNQTKAKADLILETPETILKGGESGPAVVAGRSPDSLLLQVASHQKKPMMPPKDNKVAASDLTGEELGLIKLWIDQGAKGEVHGGGPIAWQPLPEGLNPIYAVAVSPDGQFAACGRANQIFIYHLPSKELVTRLTDPELVKTSLYGKPGVAHRDMVNALSFSPDGALLASGDYRAVKLWRRPKNRHEVKLNSFAGIGPQSISVSPDGKWLATGGTDGSVKLWDQHSGKLEKQFEGQTGLVACLKFAPDNSRLCSASTNKTLRIWSVPEGILLAHAENSAEINAISWLTDSKQIASGGNDKLIRIWQLPDATGGEMTLSKDLKGHEQAVTSLEFVPAANQLLSGSADGSVCLWNLESGEVIRRIEHGGPVTAVVARGDGKRYASVGSNKVASCRKKPLDWKQSVRR